MKTEKFPRIVVMIDNFSHDTNGNPTALHTVYGYRSQDASINSPSAKLHEAKRRKQVGYGNNMDCNAVDAIEKAGLSLADYDLIRKEGDRSEGFINLVYNLKTADKPEQAQADREATKKYIEGEFLAGWTMGQGMATDLDSTIYDCEESAARAADSMAESAADICRAESENGDDE